MQSEIISHEQEAYEIEGLWRPELTSPEDKERILQLSKQVPEGVRTLLDAGCGNGMFLNYLSQGPRPFDRLCGVDRSMAALKYVQCEKRQANIDALPFRDGEFHMVTCLEVIEHLPLSMYEKALVELARVSQRHLMVSVPNEQDLDAALVQCPYCHAWFNPDYHVRSFDEARLRKLFDARGYSCREVFPIAQIETLRYLNRFRRWQLRKDIRRVPWYAICPACGWRDFARKVRSSARSAQASWRDRVKGFWPKDVKHKWIAAVYERMIN